MKKVPSVLRIPSSSATGQRPSEPSAYIDKASSSDNRREGHRWSEVVPPTAGLTFAAIWDPEVGLVSLSGAPSLALNGHRYLRAMSDDIPSDVNDHRSQVLSIDQSTVLLSENSATLALFREAHPQYFGLRTPDRSPGSTVASSTSGGYDVYVRSPRSPRSPNSPHYSCFDSLDEDLSFDPTTAFADLEQLVLRRGLGNTSVSDEGFFEGRKGRPTSDDSAVIVELVLINNNNNDNNKKQSSFSTTTTSTSNYIEVNDDFDLASDELDRSYSPRRLRKRRPVESPAKPSEVLARTAYNHVAEPAQQLSGEEKLNTLPKFVRGLKRRIAGDDRWVKVDVTEMITQCYL